MNTQSIENWAVDMEILCSRHFPPSASNVSIHFIMGRWGVRIESPKIYVSNEVLHHALVAAKSQVEILIRRQSDLARTLGVEAAE